MSSMLNLKMVGLPAPSGRYCRTMSNLSRTLFVASSISMPYSNCSVMTDTFSFDDDERCFKSLTPLRVFSKVLVIFVSISSALAPEYDVITMMALVPMSGKRLIDSLVSANTPRIATVMKTSDTVTGWLTDVLYKLMILFYLQNYFTTSTVIPFFNFVCPVITMVALSSKPLMTSYLLPILRPSSTTV